MHEGRNLVLGNIEHGDELETTKSHDGHEPVISIEELENMVVGHEVLEELLDDMLSACKRYTETVANYAYELRSPGGIMSEGFRDVDQKRGRIHDTTISAINIFARTARKEGIDVSWVDGFNNERALYGRFAILITLSRLKNTK